MDKAFELEHYEKWLKEALRKAFNTNDEQTKRDLSLEIWYCRENIDRIQAELDEEEKNYDIEEAEIIDEDCCGATIINGTEINEISDGVVVNGSLERTVVLNRPHSDKVVTDFAVKDKVLTDFAVKDKVVTDLDEPDEILVNGEKLSKYVPDDDSENKKPETYFSKCSKKLAEENKYTEKNTTCESKSIKKLHNDEWKNCIKPKKIDNNIKKQLLMMAIL